MKKMQLLTQNLHYAKISTVLFFISSCVLTQLLSVTLFAFCLDDDGDPCIALSVHYTECNTHDWKEFSSSLKCS